MIRIAAMISMVGITLIFGCGKDHRDTPKDPASLEISPDDTGPNPNSSSASNGSETPGPFSQPSIGGLAKPQPLGPNGVPNGFKSWEELNLIDPKQKSLFTFEGVDPVNQLLSEDERCAVYIIASFLNAEGQSAFAIKTSFSHNGDSHPYLIATLTVATAKSVTAADSANRSQAFFTFAESNNFYSMTAMNLKWFHINHFDTGTCENLKLRMP